MSDQKLISELKQFRDAVPLLQGLIYRMGYDFVLQHGQNYPITPYPRDGWRGLPKHCFGNAIILAATKGYKYVEGMHCPQSKPDRLPSITAGT